MKLASHIIHAAENSHSAFAKRLNHLIAEEVDFRDHEAGEICEECEQLRWALLRYAMSHRRYVPAGKPAGVKA